MTLPLFLKIKATLATEQKFIDAGPICGWLWLAGLGHCREGSTDGFIPKLVVPGLVPGLKGAYKHAARLVELGLWEDAVGGYRVHDYFDWNPSAADIEARRREDRERKERGRGVRSESARIPIGQNPVSIPRADTDAQPRASSDSDSPSDSGSAVLGEESARETPPPDAAVVVRPVRPSREWGRGSLVKPPTYHEQHCPRWGLAACRWGFCLPKYLWPQWERRGQSTAWLNSLQLFVEQVMDRTPPGGGDRVEEFWPRHFEAHFGTTAPKPTSGRMTAAQRTIATGRG